MDGVWNPPPYFRSLFRIAALKYSQELEKRALADDDDNIEEKCPEDGFHSEPCLGEDQEKDQEMDEVEENIPENVKFLRETIQHCRHFISMVACPQWQLLSMQIVAESILHIKMQQ